MTQRKKSLFFINSAKRIVTFLFHQTIKVNDEMFPSPALTFNLNPGWQMEKRTQIIFDYTIEVHVSTFGILVSFSKLYKTLLRCIFSQKFCQNLTEWSKVWDSFHFCPDFDLNTTEVAVTNTWRKGGQRGQREAGIRCLHWSRWSPSQQSRQRGEQSKRGAHLDQATLIHRPEWWVRDLQRGLWLWQAVFINVPASAVESNQGAPHTSTLQH